jgi:transposase InsO family protein
VLSRHHFTTRDQGRKIIVAWCQDFYNTRRRHSSAGLQAPDYDEKTTAEQLAAA